MAVGQADVDGLIYFNPEKHWPTDPKLISGAGEPADPRRVDVDQADVLFGRGPSCGRRRRGRSNRTSNKDSRRSSGHRSQDRPHPAGRLRKTIRQRCTPHRPRRTNP